MKPAGILGIVLIVIGVLLLAYGGYTSYHTTEQVAKLGPLEINQQKEHPVPIGPILGGVCIVGGVIVMLTGRGRAV